MKEKFKKYAAELCSDSYGLEIFKDLKNIMCENGLYHEEGACLEKIFHITKEPKLYYEIGDIFLNKVRNRDIANAAYNKYIYYSNPEFYNKWANNLKAIGYDCVDTENSDEAPFEIQNMCDKFDAIVYMMICLAKNNDYDGIAELTPNIQTMKSKLTENFENNLSEAQSCMSDLKDTENHLSDILSNIKNRNDINAMATSLNPLNKKAHINIMDDLVTNKKYSEALDFYNSMYCDRFDAQRNISIVDLCWVISDFYRDTYQFYDAVRFQKYALELELNENSEV